ncbi:Non-heme 11 kDa protein of cytochrome bc1 complex [Ascobolus immersus RN42]|uniref:Cytochrome b-c1 complex subunit 6, mitochondrial n=1 Tax=Ascobolus immersus RN42 TaxID=1160509 RepID=A0A3N4HR31_ASCIM|nr:Non-heme 11 kDa protein of cytochrome bc1 complex [Ascobolus immersus RN42]
MTLTTLFSDFVSAITFTNEVHAEEAAAEQQEEVEEVAEETPEEEEEEEEDEPVDPMPRLMEECAETPKCAPYKHHYDECTARVTGAQEAGEETNEDCVEEFFHLVHCTTQCAAPKLFAELK